MKKSIKLILITLISCVMLFILNNKTYAASATISANSSTVEVGDTIQISGSVTAAQWTLEVDADGTPLTSSEELDNYKSNISKSFSASYKATKAGTITFTLSGDITDFDQTNTPISKTVTVTVKEKSSSTTKQSEESEKSTKTEETEKEPENEYIGEEERNITEAENKEATEAKSKDQKAIELAKNKWGNDDSVTFSIEEKKGSIYYIAVKSDANVISWYEVNTDTWEISDF